MVLITNLRKPRIAKIALFDVITAILGVFIFLKLFFRNQNNLKLFFVSVLLAFLFGIVVHYVLGIPTMLNYYLGLSKKPIT